MKKILLLAAACMAGAAANAQISLDCRIKYDYDAAGNHTRRYYDCTYRNRPITNYKQDVILSIVIPVKGRVWYVSEKIPISAIPGRKKIASGMI